MASALLQRLYAELDPHEPIAASEGQRYVDWQASLEEDFKQTLERRLSRLAGSTVYQAHLLAGQRGTGMAHHDREPVVEQSLFVGQFRQLELVVWVIE